MSPAEGGRGRCQLSPTAWPLCRTWRGIRTLEAVTERSIQWSTPREYCPHTTSDTLQKEKNASRRGELDFEGATEMRDMTNDNEGSRTTIKTQNTKRGIQMATRGMTITVTTRNRRTEGWKGCQPRWPDDENQETTSRHGRKPTHRTITKSSPPFPQLSSSLPSSDQSTLRPYSTRKKCFPSSNESISNTSSRLSIPTDFSFISLDALPAAIPMTPFMSNVSLSIGNARTSSSNFGQTTASDELVLGRKAAMNPREFWQWKSVRVRKPSMGRSVW